MTQKQTITVSIRQWSLLGDGAFVVYNVPAGEQMDVLNALEYVRAHLDSSVSYRSSCRRGVCGGCLMTIDGKLRLACETEVCDGMEIDPYCTGGNSNE